MPLTPSLSPTRSPTSIPTASSLPPSIRIPADRCPRTSSRGQAQANDKSPSHLIINQMTSTDKKDFDYMFKLILIGSAAVGKSNILLKYTKDQFSESSQTTIGVEYATKIITTNNGFRIKFQIWDTAGQEKYRALMKTYYKGASAALIVYDITREDSFLNLENEQKLIKDFIKGDIITMIVGNKIDLEQKRVVSKQRGLEYAESKKIAFYEVSAKDGTNINLIFTRIAEELEKAVTQNSKVEGQKGGKQPRKGSLSEQPQNPKKKKEQEVIILNKQNEQKRKLQSKAGKKKCCE